MVRSALDASLFMPWLLAVALALLLCGSGLCCCCEDGCEEGSAGYCGWYSSIICRGICHYEDSHKESAQSRKRASSSHRSLMTGSNKGEIFPIGSLHSGHVSSQTRDWGLMQQQTTTGSHVTNPELVISFVTAQCTHTEGCTAGRASRSSGTCWSAWVVQCISASLI